MDRHSKAYHLLGRLDGRLSNSPASDIWLAHARLNGAVSLANLAGVPITREALLSWICTRTPPPRRSEGLNDPLSIAALFHFALQSTEMAGDAISDASLRSLRSLLDDREEAHVYAASDLAWFGPVFIHARNSLSAPLPFGLSSLAKRLIEVHREIGQLSANGRLVTTIDGRRLMVEPQTFDTVWVLGTLLPRTLVTAGLTSRPLPSMVLLPRFLPQDPAELEAKMLEALERVVCHDLSELDNLERRVAQLPAQLPVTRRSKAPLLARLRLVYPDLPPSAVARLLGITPQGARKLVGVLERLQVQW